MTSVSIADAVIDLANTFSGQLLKPADVGYDEARTVHNGLVDKRPALIARCCGVADVVDAVNLTSKLGLEVAVRGGGHNVAGRSTINGGGMIDLMPMQGIHVDLKNERLTYRVASLGPSSIVRRSCTVWRLRAEWFRARGSLG
jgi:hypothetical protein